MNSTSSSNPNRAKKMDVLMLIWHHSFHSSRGSSSCAQERKLNQPSMLQETLTIFVHISHDNSCKSFFLFKLNYRLLYPGATFTSSLFFFLDYLILCSSSA